MIHSMPTDGLYCCILVKHKKRTPAELRTPPKGGKTASWRGGCLPGTCMQGSFARSQAALIYHAGLTAALPARRRSPTRCAWCACCRHSAAGATLQQTSTPLRGSVAHGSKRAPMCQHTGAKSITMLMESCCISALCYVALPTPETV